jgi:hypothetical protein
LKSAPPEPPALVDVPPDEDGVVCVGVDVPPVACGVVVTGGVTAVPPDEEVEPEDAGVDVGVLVVVVDVVVVDDGVVEDAAGVPPEGGAVRTGVVLGTL